MFLFKNTKSKAKRIAMNMAVYGFAGAFVLMMFAVFLPEVIANYVYVLMVVFSVVCIIGSMSSIVCFFIELFSPVKEHRTDTVANAIAPKCPSCGIAISRERTQCVSCEWAENKFSKNNEIFKMKTKKGRVYNFTYSGYTRFHPNYSLTCYGSDDWMYLCEENGVHFLLRFSDNAEYGTGWICTELHEGDYERLINQDGFFWGSIACSRERKKTYDIRLTDVDTVRHLLPTSSSCCSKLTDEHYLR